MINLTVRNSHLRSRSFGVKVGTETHGNMSGLHFDKITIANSHQGIGIDWRGQGHFTDSSFTNLHINRVEWDGSGVNFTQNWMGDAQPISVTNTRTDGLMRSTEPVGQVRPPQFASHDRNLAEGYSVLGSADKAAHLRI